MRAVAIPRQSAHRQPTLEAWGRPWQGAIHAGFCAKENVMRLLAPILAGACFLFAVTSCPAVDHTVIVGGGTIASPDIGFHPYEITINVGDTITFESPPAGLEHNVRALDGSFRCAVGCDGAGGNGDPSLAGWSDTLTFDHAATINYQCDPHASMGMRGVIHVVDGSPPPPPGNVPITAGFTGAWYDPTQSGHGIFLEVLQNNQLLAFWYTFNPDGTQQSWFGNVGAIDGTTATVAALQTQGGQWIPNFNPANVTQPSWGTLTFSFTDCNHGRVDFSSSVVGYGEGHMDLTRLTQPAGLACP
jgi:plastocyanin